MLVGGLTVGKGGLPQVFNGAEVVCLLLGFAVLFCYGFDQLGASATEAPGEEYPFLRLAKSEEC